MKTKKFSCAACGGTVKSKTGLGRHWEYIRGVPAFEVPADLDIPECIDCGERYLLPENSERLKEHLETQFKQWQAKHLTSLVQRLCDHHGVTKAQVAGVCGITPSHLSHLLNPSHSEARPSVTLLRLLECFARCESEFARHVRGTTFDIYLGCPFPVRNWSRAGEPCTDDAAEMTEQLSESGTAWKAASAAAPEYSALAKTG